MATKSYKLRLDLRVMQPVVDIDRFGNDRVKEMRQVQQWLDDTREAFNTGVDYLTGWLLRMHRGAGVYREKRDGIWREWQEITTLDVLNEARSRYKTDPGSFAMLENRKLLDAFKGKGNSEAEAFELAECCRRLILHKTLLGAKRENAPMSRGALDDLTPSRSSKRGKRPEGKRGRWARWQLDKAILEEAAHSHSTADLLNRLGERMEFADGKKDAAKRLQEIKNKANGQSWSLVKQWLDETCGSWQEKQRESEANRADWDQLLQPLRDAGVLPLPEFARPTAHVGITGKVSVWNYAMWNMAGQRVRSHLGWVRRRERERVIWELRKSLFEHGGWERTKRNGKKVTKEKLEKAVLDRDLKPEDLIRFDQPLEDQIGDFEQRPAYAQRKWLTTLREEYEEKEMLNQLGGVAFGAAEPPRILKKTAKGWAKVRDKWLELITKANSAGKPAQSADDLLEAFDQMRTRKTRDFGGRRLFEWLAVANRRWLWDGTDKGEDNDCGTENRDCVTAFYKHNGLLADKPKSITWTQVDPVKHPVWPFFGENSAVKYTIRREFIHNDHGEVLKDKEGRPRTRLVLCLNQLVRRQDDGPYTAVDNVKIALRGYDDFEGSFQLPEPRDAKAVTREEPNAKKVRKKNKSENGTSATETLIFRDDLLGGETWQGKLAGLKLIWERDELEAHNRMNEPRKTPPRIYASFSCNVGREKVKDNFVTKPPAWLTDNVVYDFKFKKPRDGMTRGCFLKKEITKESPDEENEIVVPPAQRKWPREAIDHSFTVRGTDLGYRTSSAGAYWRLSLDKPEDLVAWAVGTCDSKPVYAVLERTSTVSLPGDGESLPPDEQNLRERLFSLRTRLNLNNSLLRIARLLALEAVSQRKSDGDKVRKRSDGTTKRIGTKWKTENRPLDGAEIQENCRKAAAQLARWASTDAMTESLKAIGYEGSIWGWLANRDASLLALAEKLPTTDVPTEKQAQEQGVDRDAAMVKRKDEDDAFAEEVHRLRVALTKALCDGHDAEKRCRATAGLWFEFDAALMREVSYSDRRRPRNRKRIAEAHAPSHRPGTFEDGLFRLLRRPPVTKHQDSRDDANNLPHGRTHRGGLSMNRLNFLDDVKNFVRRWSCRPRWPGDVRRVPRDAKVNRGDTEHVDNLREHRAKLIAHADVAQTLGFEQDLRRGLWQYRDDATGQLLWHRPERGHFYRQNGEALVQCAAPAGVIATDAGHPHCAYAPAHVLVYEDLTRYSMKSDRPKNENAGLARWSHRRILAFAQHIGGLFGVPVATVDARFSSRYCSHCGAPGCRAMRFDPAWLGQAWMQRIREDSQDQSTASRNLRKVADEVEERLRADPHAYDNADNRPWVLRDGGPDFVCSNPKCAVQSSPISADENAAANVGLRFLRGIEALRVYKTASGSPKTPIGYIPPEQVMGKVNGEDYWIMRPASIQASENEIEDPRLLTLFRDPSGGCLPADRWYETKRFWGQVANMCASALGATNASRWPEEESDDDA